MPRKGGKQTPSEFTAGAEPEPVSQDAEGDAEDSPAHDDVIILHPGSCTLHVGLASEHSPHSLPHLIAYRASGGGATPTCHAHTDHSLTLQYEQEMTPELEARQAAEVAGIHRALGASREAVGMGGCEVEEESYTGSNARAQPVPRDSDDLALTNLSAAPPFVIGNDALYLPPDAGYLVYKPIRRGRLNVGPGVSVACVLSQLEDLWSRAVEEYLDIPRKEFKFCRVILLVSDVVDRTTIVELVNVLLLRMEFAAALVHQESLCALYGAGLSTACVVNVGDEVTHVCCVEDGMSNPNTRLMLHYGGGDITRLFCSMIKKLNFPYRNCSSDSRLDALLIQQLKESACHLDQTVWGVHDHPFSVMAAAPGKVLDYEMKMGDESIVAPMGVFFPRAFCLRDDQPLMEGQPFLPPHSQDLFDEGHWLADGGAGGVVKKPYSVAGRELGPEGGMALPEATRRLWDVPPGKIFGLDEAIHFSIDCATSVEVKKKLYGSVLLIGGGLAYPGAAAMLQARLELGLPPGMAHGTDTVEVFSNPKDLESGVVAWRGAAVLKCLDTSQELWVEHLEWDFSGARLLRERAPFQW